MAGHSMNAGMRKRGGMSRTKKNTKKGGMKYGGAMHKKGGMSCSGDKNQTMKMRKKSLIEPERFASLKALYDFHMIID